MDNKLKLGLTLGIFFGAAHLLWAICILIGIAKPFMDWMLAMHFMVLPWTVLTFNVLHALILVVVTFVCGFIYGWLIGWVWSWFGKKRK
jgi:hypothetical protein